MLVAAFLFPTMRGPVSCPATPVPEIRACERTRIGKTNLAEVRAPGGNLQKLIPMGSFPHKSAVHTIPVGEVAPVIDSMRYGSPIIML